MRERLRHATRLVRLFFLRAAAPRGRRYVSLLVIGLLSIMVWQMTFSSDQAQIDDKYKITASSGVHNDRHFVYFLWYTNRFPVVSTLAYYPCSYKCADKTETGAPGPLSTDGALSVYRNAPNTLFMDSSWTWMGGDRGKIFLYMLDTWLKGAPYKPSMKPMHRFAFTVSLMATFAAFWWARRWLIGAAIVLLVGSNPLQLYEVNVNDNVFGWSITTAMLMLALHVPLLTGRSFRARRVWIFPLVAGFLMATIRTFRSEPVLLSASCLGAYLLTRIHREHAEPARRARVRTWLQRLGMVGIFLGVFWGAGKAYQSYFEFKHVEARNLLARIGGHPFPGPLRMYHHFWHPIWCGLGDFDTKYGYVWEDTAALRYARPILENDFHEYVPQAGWADLGPGDVWDPDSGRYYKKFPYDTPHYEDVIRDKVLSDIKRDPKWYLGILGSRIKRVLTEGTPVRITTKKSFHAVPGKWGVWFLPLLALVAFARSRLFLTTMLFTIPSCATALVVYSGGGTQWYGIFHLFGAVVVLALFAQGARMGARALRRRIRAT